MDDLAIVENYELESMQNRFKDQIKNARRRGESTEQAEIELSYVQREIDVRIQRERHVEKMRREGLLVEYGV